ncbi:MAG: pyrroline-5-carboxylate reductase [Rhodoferax sp.]
MDKRIAFIGGGNMANAIIGGLLRQGMAPSQIDVVEPFAETGDKLKASCSVNVQTQAGAFLANAELVIWAIKPQTFRQAALQARLHTGNALHLSVAAGIRSDSIAQWLGSERVVRAMPNTPALIGKGISALFARPAVNQPDKDWIARVMAGTGELLWLDAEEQLDGVTALSGSGPAYLFYFMEAMTTGGVEMGLTRAQAHQLTVATFVGASALAHASSEPPKVLRQRVTSKGGTTDAAIASMEDEDMQAQLINAMYAARQRAKELGDQFGAS